MRPAVVGLAVLFTSVAAQNLTVELYSEALCPDCYNFEIGAWDTVWNSPGFQGILTSYEQIPYGNAKNASGRVTCQHGVNECKGNMQQACIIKYHPKTADHLPILVCQVRAYPQGGPAVLAAAQTCVEAAGFDFAPIAKCYGDGAGDEGVALIEANAARTGALQPPHTSVPWVVINGKPVDLNCQGDPVCLNANFMKYVCDAYKAGGGTAPPAACGAASTVDPAQLEAGRRLGGSKPTCPKAW